MESIIPRNEWKLIAPFYVRKERGRKRIPLETMLRMYLMQNRFGLSDEGIGDAVYDSCAMKRFLKTDFSIERTPDATTLLHFRHLPEKHDITRKMFDLFFASANLVMCLRAGRQREFCMTMG